MYLIASCMELMITVNVIYCMIIVSRNLVPKQIGNEEPDRQ